MELHRHSTVAADAPPPETDRRAGADPDRRPPHPAVGTKSPARRPTEGSGGVRRHRRGVRAGWQVQARRLRAINYERQHRWDHDRAMIPLPGPGLAPGIGVSSPAQTRGRPGPTVGGCRKDPGSESSRRVEGHLPLSGSATPIRARILSRPPRLSLAQTRAAETSATVINRPGRNPMKIGHLNPISGWGGCFYPPLGFFLNISQTA